MCGINGFTFQDEKLIEKMNQVTIHRGPDGNGKYLDDNISLGHNRLSIIDLDKRAGQPMYSSNERYVIVFNGEIYNYKEIKEELGDYDFKTTSDTEVILAAFKKWGSECVKKFKGIFAIAIWDKKTKELFLARDHFGVKPLFYYLDDEKLIFSSEIKAILEHDIKRGINKQALNTYFRLLYVNGPETIWKNIYKLPSASFAVYKNKKLDIKRYWQIDNFTNLNNKEEIKSGIKDLLKKSVKRQMVADVPVGVFLSGGIDSTIMLGLASEQSKTKLKTFSVGFDVDQQTERFNQDYNLAKKTAQHFGTEHFDIKLCEQDVIQHLEKIVWHMDDLVSNPTQVANIVLSKMAAKEVKVVLGGDGGDELFGGYPRYYYYDLISKWQKIPKIFRDNIAINKGAGLFKKDGLLNRINSSELDLYWSFMARKEKLLSRMLKNNYSNVEPAKKYFQNNLNIKNKSWNSDNVDMTKRIMNMDIDTWLLDYSLTGTDKMTMANGLEQRVPFLDKDLAELAMRIPTKYKLDSKKQGKKILKDAMNEYIPDFILNQKKAGWVVPISKWLRTGLKDFAYGIIDEDYNKKQTNDVIDFVEARKILDDHISGKEYALHEVWSLLVFQIWFKQFVR